jgi:hypothetical protein
MDTSEVLKSDDVCDLFKCVLPRLPSAFIFTLSKNRYARVSKIPRLLLILNNKE